MRTLHTFLAGIVRQAAPAALLALFASLFWQAPASAQTRIVALVNGTPITSTEVGERRGFIRITQRKEVNDKTALEVLIDEVLVQQEGKRRQMTVADSEVDQRFAAIATNAKLSVQQLGQALAQGGASARTFKDNIRSQLLQRKLVTFRLRATGAINEKDIALQLTQRREQGQAANYRYTLQQIVFVIPQGAAPAVVAQRRKEADGLRTRITACEQGGTFAKGLRDVAVKEPITRMSSQISPSFRNDLAAMKIGQATKPEAKDNGVEIVMLCDKQEVADDTALRSEIQNELAGEASKAESEKFIAELRQKALITYR